MEELTEAERERAELLARVLGRMRRAHRAFVSTMLSVSRSTPDLGLRRSVEEALRLASEPRRAYRQSA